MVFVVLGLLVFGFGLIFFSGFVWSVVDELYVGILEYFFVVLMKRIMFFFGNVLVRFFFLFFYMVIYFLVFKLFFGLGIDFLVVFKVFLVLFFGSFGMVGFGMVVVGIVFYFKDLGFFISILEMFVFVFSGVMYFFLVFFRVF